ncbi:MAG: DUF4286 family protein [Phycisphaerales bacterium]
MPTRIAYAVRATLPNETLRDEYVRWLTAEGHVRDVLAGGASTGDVVVFDREEGEPIRVEVRYTFPSREAFDDYVRDHAPALRQEGIDRFGDRGITFERNIGEIAEG